MKGKSFVSQQVQLTECEENTQVRLVPSSRVFRGCHRFKFTAVGDKTKVDYEVEMDPKGIWKLIPPLVSTEVKATLFDTASALQAHLEHEQNRR